MIIKNKMLKGNKLSHSNNIGKSILPNIESAALAHVRGYLTKGVYLADLPNDDCPEGYHFISNATTEELSKVDRLIEKNLNG